MHHEVDFDKYEGEPTFTNVDYLNMQRIDTSKVTINYLQVGKNVIKTEDSWLQFG